MRCFDELQTLSSKAEFDSVHKCNVVLTLTLLLYYIYYLTGQVHAVENRCYQVDLAVTNCKTELLHLIVMYQMMNALELFASGLHLQRRKEVNYSTDM